MMIVFIELEEALWFFVSLISEGAKTEVHGKNIFLKYLNQFAEQRKKSGLFLDYFLGNKTKKARENKFSLDSKFVKKIRPFQYFLFQLF